MATPLETLVVSIETNMAKFVNETQQMSGAVNKMSRQIESSLGQVKAAFAGLALGYSITQVLSMADSYNVLQSRIQMATQATGDYLGVSRELQRISQQTGATLRDSTNVFQRLSLAAGSLGASNKQLLTLTATVQKLGVMSGASVQGMQAGLLQFGQAMGAGIVRAEEFNSLIENMPLVAQKIAEGMGMTTAELRKLVLAGKVASKDVFDSLMKQSGAIAKEFEKMPLSLERAMNNLKGSMEAALGKLDTSIGITRTLAQGLQLIADNATLAVNAVIGLGVGVAVFKTLTLDVTALTASMSALTAVMSANPWLLVAGAIAATTAAVVAFRDETFKIGDSTVTLANLTRAAWETLGANIQASWSKFTTKITQDIDAGRALVESLFKSVGDVMSGFYAKLAEGEARVGTMRYAFKQLWDGVIRQAGEAAKFLGSIFEKIGNLPMFAAFRQMSADASNFAQTVTKRAEELTRAQREQAEVSDKIAQSATRRAEIDEKSRKKHERDLETVKKMVEEWDRQAEAVGKVTAQKKVMMDLEKAIAEIRRKSLTDEEKAAAIAQLRADAAARVYNLNQIAYTKEMESLSEITKKWADKAEAAKPLTEEQKVQLELNKAIEEINKKHVGQLDKEVAILKVTTAATQEIANIRAKDVAKQREEMVKRIADLKVQEEAAERQLKGLPEITEQMKMQAAIEKAIKDGKTENLDLMNQQIDALKRIDVLQQKAKEEKSYKDELKRIDEIVAGYKDQQEAITAKANGQENLLPLLKEERKIQEEIKKIQESKVFTDDEKSTKTQELQQKIQQVRDGHAVTQQFNQQVEAQEKLIQKITGSSRGYYNQIADLREAFSTGQITLHQYTEAWRKLQEGTKSASDAGKEFGDSIGRALEDGIINGKKMTDVIKDLGKELKAMAIRKLFIDPVKEKAGLAFDAIARNLFGVGRSPSLDPAFNNKLPPGVGPLAMPGVAANSPGSIPGLPGGGVSGQSGLLGRGTVQAGSVYAQGPVYISGASVSMQGPQVSASNPNFNLPPINFTNNAGGGGTFSGGGLSGLLNGLMGGLSNLFNPIKQLLGGIGSSPGGMMGGLGGGLLGGISGLFSKIFGGGQQIAGPINPASQSIFSGLGGLLNPFGFLGGIGKAFGATMGGDSIFKNVAPLLNPFGFLGGLGKAAGATLGGDSIFRDVAPLLNPFGFIKGLGGAIGGIFGGAKAMGGKVVGSQSYLVGEYGPELFTPHASGYITPNRSLDYAGLSQAPGGTPMYQQMQSFAPDFSMFNSYARAGEDGMQGARLQQLLAKRDAYFAMTPEEQMRARMTGDGYFNSQDNYEVEKILRTIPLTVMNQLADHDSNMLRAHTDAVLQSGLTDNFTRGWATSTQANATWAAISRALPPSLRNFSFALGNQNANILNRWKHRGITAGAELSGYANALDFVRDRIAPVGGYTAFAMGYNSMGMGSGDPAAAFHAGDNDNMLWGNYDSDFGNLIKQPGWGDGVGYARGAHKPRPFANNSLLGTGGNGVTNTGIWGKPTDPNFAGGNGGSWVGSWEKPGYALPNAEWGEVDKWGFSKKGSASGSEATIAGMSPFYDGESGRIEDFKRYANKLLDVWDKGGQMDMMIGGANSPKYFAGILYKQLEGLRNAGASDGQLLNVWQQGTRGWSQKDSYPVLQALGINSSAPMGYAFPVGDSQTSQALAAWKRFNATAGGNVASQYNDVFSGGWQNSAPATAPTHLPMTGHSFDPITAGQIWGMMGGNRQAGGPVEPGKVYQWNENGREMLMSSKPGHVLSADDVRRRDRPNVVIHNNTPIQIEQNVPITVDEAGNFQLFLNQQRRSPNNPNRGRGYRRS